MAGVIFLPRRHKEMFGFPKRNRRPAATRSPGPVPTEPSPWPHCPFIFFQINKENNETPADTNGAFRQTRPAPSDQSSVQTHSPCSAGMVKPGMNVAEHWIGWRGGGFGRRRRLCLRGLSLVFLVNLEKINGQCGHGDGSVGEQPRGDLVAAARRFLLSPSLSPA